MKIVSIAALLGAASAAPMAFTNADGTISEHLSGGLAHDSARHDERCAAGDDIDCQVSVGWSFGACTTTCGQGTATRTRAVTVTPCNNGAACPATSQTQLCMLAVCSCEKVECKFETHSCTNYQDAQTGVQYHSDTELWSGYGSAPNGNVAAANAMVATPSSATARHTSIAERDTRGSTGNAGFTSGFDNRHDEVNAASGNANYGLGDQHGTETSTDGHDFSGTCVNTESVRVYHKNEVATMGHHCKHTKGGLCKCKCNTLFKGAYNPRTLDLYSHTIALPAADAPTLQPTSHPTSAPTAPTYARTFTNPMYSGPSSNYFMQVENSHTATANQICGRQGCPADPGNTQVGGGVTVPCIYHAWIRTMDYDWSAGTATEVLQQVQVVPMNAGDSFIQCDSLLIVARVDCAKCPCPSGYCS